MLFGDGKKEGREPVKRSVPILTYHRVCGDPAAGAKRYAVTPSEFRLQMEYLARARYNVVSLGEAVAHFTSGKWLPKKPVVITFDDGYMDNYTFALPILERYGFKATIFLVAEMMGRRADWDAALGDPVPELMTWEQALEMARRGVQLGAHTCNHAHLLQLTPSQSREEISRSKRLVEDKLQEEVPFFAYPFKEYNQLLRRYVIESGYSAACGSEWGVSDQSDDIYLLRRMTILEHHLMPLFQWLIGTEEPKSWASRLTRGKHSAVVSRLSALASRRKG